MGSGASRLAGERGVPECFGVRRKHSYYDEKRVDSPPTVAASLFCYMDDEVDVWAPCMRRAATVFLPSDE